MSDQPKLSHFTFEEYLEHELVSNERHEFVDGRIFSMSGATRAHSIICGNLFALIHSALKGGHCRAFMCDMRLKLAAKNTMYYPDLLVSCEMQDSDALWIEQPELIVEVASKSTRAIDRREKLVAYCSIVGLKEYVLIEQNQMRVSIFRRTADAQWETLAYLGDDQFELVSVPLRDITVSQLYDGIEFVPTVKEEDEDYVLRTR